MTQSFSFYSTTTFIDKPRDTIIQNFQNTYISGSDSNQDKINSELMKLVELILTSKKLLDEEKEETLQAVHGIAENVKEKKTNKLTVKGTLEAVQHVVSNAADIVGPATSIISGLLKYFGIM